MRTLSLSLSLFGSLSPFLCVLVAGGSQNVLHSHSLALSLGLGAPAFAKGRPISQTANCWCSEQWRHAAGFWRKLGGRYGLLMGCKPNGFVLFVESNYLATMREIFVEVPEWTLMFMHYGLIIRSNKNWLCKASIFRFVHISSCKAQK